MSGQATRLLLALTAGALCAALAGCEVHPVRAQASSARACRVSDDCAPEEYCQHALGLCGRAQQAGRCARKSEACESAEPVCGCDGRVYPDACAARAVGVDLSRLGGCRAEVRDHIPCGAYYCDARESYCEIYMSDVLEPPGTSTCRALPAACRPGAGAAPSCDCFDPATPCLSFCGPTWTGGVPGFHLTCQALKEPSGAPPPQAITQ